MYIKTMKEVILLLLIINVVFSSALLFGQRSKRSSDTELNSNPKSPDVNVSEPRFFTQKLDHFNPADDRKFIQRYWVSQKHFRKGGPAFLIANGEWLVEYGDGELDGDPIMELFAKDLKAAIFSLEHRYYGKSWPAKEDKHYYLNSRQAITDIANFIKSMTKIYKLPKDTKWIVIGCSYAGMLTTWARLKYPHLIHGALASSAPILAKVDYYEYHQIIDESLKSYDQKCFEKIALVTEEIARLINSTKNIQNIMQTLNLCDDHIKIKNTADLAAFLHNEMKEILFSSVQVNNPVLPMNIANICELAMNYNLTKIEIFNEFRKGHAIYKKNVEDDSFDKSSDLWSYQDCSEFGHESSYYKNSPLFILSRMIPIETEVKKKCGKFRGPNFGAKEMNEKISQTNLLYGGLDINIGNMIFTHGSLDPWHAAGLYQKKNGALYETIFINGTSHCADVIFSDMDPPQLKNARVKVLNLMKSWLQK